MTGTVRGRTMKKQVEDLLLSDSFRGNPESIRNYPVKQTINTLISFFCSLNDLLKWRAVTGAGLLVSDLACDRIEDARIIMRRLMWTLNEESGGIGWGAPEAMGEIMAQSPALAAEYNRILTSYIDEEGNYLEHVPLQHGVLWAIARLSESAPKLMESSLRLTRPFLTSGDPTKRGLACIISGHLKDNESRDGLEKLIVDKTLINLYKDRHIKTYTIGDLAENALSHLP